MIKVKTNHMDSANDWTTTVDLCKNKTSAVQNKPQIAREKNKLMIYSFNTT